MKSTRGIPLILCGAIALVWGAVAPCERHADAQSISPPLLADATEPPAPFAAVLRAIPRATAVRVHDGWMGLSPIAPIDDRFEFRRIGDDFQGHGVCRAAAQEHPLPDVTFPVATVSAALARLVHVSVSRGPYRPIITHTDDYPRVTIELDTPAGSVTFTSRSQGRFAPPWEITLASGDTGVVSDRVPGDVVSALLAPMNARACGDWTRTLHRH